MDKKFLFRLAQIWWVGFKVMCRWFAFGIVLTVLFFPATALSEFVHSLAGHIVSIIYVLLIVPIVFYITSRYLLLLGDNAPDMTHDSESASKADQHGQKVPEVQVSQTTAKPVFPAALLLLLVLTTAATVITPPDVVVQVVAAAEMVIVYGIVIFIISRFKSFKQTPETIKKMIMVLLCLLSVSIVFCGVLFQAQYQLRMELSEQNGTTESAEMSLE